MRLLHLALLASLLAFGAVGAAAPAAAQGVTDSLFQAEHVFGIEYAADPQIAPDGDEVVYVRRFMDKMEDTRGSELWTVDTDGTGHRPLTDEDARAGSPRWSPSGDRLAYVASAGEGDGAEIFVRWMDTGQTARVTRLDQSPSGLAWSPDGTHLAFAMRVEASVNPLPVDLPSKPEGADWAAPAEVVHKVEYRYDGAGRLPDGHTQLFVVPADGGTPRQVTSGPYDHGGAPEWTPDGDALIFSANRNENAPFRPLDSEVYRVALDDGTITPLTDRDGPDSSPALSPDGAQIAYTGFTDEKQGYQVTRLSVMDADGSDARVLTPNFGRDIQNPTWAADGEGLYFQYDDEGTTRIGYIPLDGSRRVLASDVGGTSIGRPYASGSFSVADDGRFAFTHVTTERPAEVAVGQAGQDPQVLTELSADLFGQLPMGQVEEFTYESSHDGRTIEGWIVKPPNFDPDETYPLILEIHGGPFANYGPRFSAEVQRYAAAGYVVLYTNPRGSTSYGADFGNAIHHAYPGNDYDDLMSGVDAVIERGYVDEDQLFVTGGSGGGVLTAWIVGHTDRFAAAVVAKPVINWYSFVLTADAYPFFTQYWFPGDPWAHQEHYMERSPISYVDNVSTPTMLMTGEQDLRTPTPEAEQFYQALQLRDVETAMVRLPEASHSIAARPSYLIAKVEYILAWFEKYRNAEE
jgi:acylaminoacyl-peptidase